ncbi:DctP family TRAP transporter solute-binding subunit [Shouchella shacheensis]|uniref:DctP family TRAP transporter solute-binding subunit n=1 Tax=Shouchella shacheensis TaxID=1649580 RepID=UPI0007400608|nr:DctP family TRAP transporter solute-binding subunit [Shouchella shacheensis]
MKKGRQSLNMKKRSSVLLTLLLALTVALAACGDSESSGQEEGTGDSEDSDDSIVLQLGHGAQESHPLQDASEEFADIVAEETDGAVQVDVYGNTQLGEEREMIEGLQLGTVDLTIVDTAPVTGFASELGVVNLPFLFSSSEHAHEVLDGEIGQDLLGQLEDSGIVGLSFMENGWRHLSVDNQITGPEDLSGLNIRTMENQVHMAAFEAMGASPVPMEWGEVYTGLQQGTIDGQENPVPIVYTNNLWEVQDYYALTGHFYSPYVFAMSEASMDELTEEQKQVIWEAAEEVTQYQRELIAEMEEEQLELLEEEGMEVYDVDRDAFQEATQSVYEEYEDEFGADLIQQILDMGE